MATSTGHITSYYAASASIPPAREPLKSDRRAQVCVVGGGLAGITCARELAKAGQDVILLEAKRIAWAASGRNGGFVSDGFAEGMGEITAAVGTEQAKRLFQLSQDGAAYVREAIHELGQPDLIQGTGGLSLIRHGKREELRQKAIDYSKLFGVEREYLTGNELEKRVNAPIYKAGLFNPEAFHIQPLAYANYLAADAGKCGVEIYENTRVTQLSRREGSWLVDTPNGKVIADNVVLATSVYGGVFAPLERSLVPVSTYVISTKPLGSQLDNVINFRGTISDSRRAGDYYRVVGEGENRRLIWGGRITTQQRVPKRLESLLKKDITSIFPSLRECEIEYAWAGKMGYTRHKMPLIGMLWPDTAPNLWVATGFGGHGLNTTAMGGKIIAEALTKQNESWREFQAFSPKWTGGVIGRCAVQMSYWAMQIRDKIDER